MSRKKCCSLDREKKFVISRAVAKLATTLLVTISGFRGRSGPGNRDCATADKIESVGMQTAIEAKAQGRTCSAQA